MAAAGPDRASHFPAIEAKHGQPMAFWFRVMKDIEDRKYPEQIAYLRENHGFSQAHANALVMYSRGSTSSRRFGGLDDYLARVDEPRRSTVEAILEAVTSAVRGSEVVIAWNKPMVRLGSDYLFGVDVAKAHVLLLPWGDLLDEFRPRLSAYQVNKKTIRVPADWKVDRTLLRDMAKARVAQLQA